MCVCARVCVCVCMSVCVDVSLQDSTTVSVLNPNAQVWANPTASLDVCSPAFTEAVPSWLEVPIDLASQEGTCWWFGFSLENLSYNLLPQVP